ncbi:unnamed protein product [Pleuronectes platessa]|uniref:Uncharacterized protein n=1 Tax=Pleuronectes platessa TaxID=8262 RepID=A0A9N7ZCE6_PLEPL|nr:unnamed protein product [Pleuronectes platessa]
MHGCGDMMTVREAAVLESCLRSQPSVAQPPAEMRAPDNRPCTLRSGCRIVVVSERQWVESVPVEDHGRGGMSSYKSGIVQAQLLEKMVKLPEMCAPPHGHNGAGISTTAAARVACAVLCIPAACPPSSLPR